jgi:putative component of membrane protein insertase Oxa1/YidC/SpoIIIJ protein YidD
MAGHPTADGIRVAAATGLSLLLAAGMGPAVAASADETDLRGAIVSGIATESLDLRPGPAAERGPMPSTARATPTLLRRLLTAPIVFHQRVLSAHDGDTCTFRPSCSEYAVEAIARSGLAGWVRASDRLLRCHPWNWADYPSMHGWKYDPVVREGASSPNAGGAVAGGLLSLVPGLGQVVAGRTGDGIYALGTVALFGLGSFYYARHEKPVAAAALGGVGLFFYAGNIYGGAAAMGRARTGGPGR